jgi:hypothetical protein
MYNILFIGKASMFVMPCCIFPSKVDLHKKFRFQHRNNKGG